MKRGRLPSSSEDSDDNGSLSTTWSQNSRSQHRRSSCSRHEDRKPSEVFRTDLITAMKLHDSYQLNPDEYYVLADPWRQEWEKGVQVPVSPGTIPQPVARVVSEEKSLMFIRPKKYIVSSGSEPPELGYVDIRTLADSVCRYDLNDMDAAWLELTNEEFKEMGSMWHKGNLVPCFPVNRVVSEEKSLMFIRPKKYIVSSGSEPPELGYVDIRTLADSVCRYDLNDMDAAWLELTNEEFKEMAGLAISKLITAVFTSLVPLKSFPKPGVLSPCRLCTTTLPFLSRAPRPLPSLSWKLLIFVHVDVELLHPRKLRLSVRTPWPVGMSHMLILTAKGGLEGQVHAQGMPELDEYTMERVLEEFEQRCYDNMNHAIETEEGLGIEYDEDVVCDVCQSPDGEDGNEMVFCDKCNICVHQACYGILKVPEGSWLCRTCALGVQPKCLLCPKKGGAMKPTRSGTKWVHVSCALWIPEVSIGSPEKMEPITKVSHIPSSRWALVCSLCNEKFGASIQCSVKNCRTAFHVTCAFDRGLEMKTILAENDEVKFKSYCPKHSSHRKPEENLGEGPTQENGAPECSPREPLEPFASLEQNREDAHRVSVRKQKLQQLEDEFYTFVNLLDVARALRLPEEVVDFLYQYWKLKRKVNFNKPLITPKKDEEDNLAKREQDVLFRRLQLFTHLRQDLERVMIDTDTL
ncbi:Protein Jade-1 [Tupaia chinensis]|uniref:Protein Jade-1 n=1 Tax=Tupaia chinensis TaxID=246437 RepID=L9KIB0_TUPCH|nr:Protein Jade-1 [Tupaia chinensis]